MARYSTPLATALIKARMFARRAAHYRRSTVMARRLSEHAELRFVRTASTGTVHLNVTIPAWADTSTSASPDLDGGAAFVAFAMSTRTVLCGLYTMPQACVRHESVGRFADEDLCRGCYRALHADDQWRAFEHPQPA